MTDSPRLIKPLPPSWEESRPAPAQAADFSLERLTEADLPAVLALERLCYSQPWTEENFRGEFHRRITLSLGLKAGRELGAYCFFWLLAPEIHLLNLAVRPAFRRLGLARRLITAMISIGRRAEARFVFLEARPTNLPALALYQSRGFTITGRRPAYYEDGEDAVLMTLDLEAAARPGL